MCCLSIESLTKEWLAALNPDTVGQSATAVDGKISQPSEREGWTLFFATSVLGVTKLEEWTFSKNFSLVSLTLASKGKAFRGSS